MVWFACANRRPIGTNTGGVLNPRGLILHHAVGSGSNFGHFNSPSARVSAHFWVSRSGVIEQYVDTNVVAWHGMQLNGSYCGTETEGCGVPPHNEPMTEAMIDALARLYKEGMQRHGWAGQIINSAGPSGFGFHRMPGSGAATGCPCDVRLNRREEILRRAGGAPVGPPPGPPPPPTTGAPPFPGRLLRQGVSGADVRTWQSRMAARGWRIGVDGMYGPESAGVCTAFQREKALGVDGIVGPVTWAASWTAPIT